MDLIKEYWVKYTTHLKSHFQLIPPFVLDEIAALLILQMRFNERSLMHLDVLISLNIHLSVNGITFHEREKSYGWKEFEIGR